jgi:hypothetical protein
MAIKFFCKCGKKLKARDEMAGRRSMCPRCGSPVGIPSLTPTYPGARLGPMSLKDRLQFWRTRLPSEALPKSLLPEEPTDASSRDALRSGAADESSKTSSPLSRDAQRSARREKPPATFDTPLDQHLVQQVLALRRPRKPLDGREGRLETHWYQCLLFPFRAWPLVFGLATAFALCTAVFAVVMSRADGSATMPGWAFWLHGLWAVIPLLVLSYLFGFLDCVMASGIAGEYRHVRWPGRKIGLALKSCVIWFLCFLAGPIIPFALALIFWLRAGEMEVVDWLILAELVIVAVSYWILVVLTVNAKDGLASVNPMRVADQINRLGWRSLGVAVGGAFLLLVHGLVAVAAIADLQRDQGWGWFLLVLCCMSGTYWTTFLFRLLGVWCHRLDLPAPARPIPSQ